MPGSGYDEALAFALRFAMKPVWLACALMLCGFVVSPATAGDNWRAVDFCYWCSDDNIYGLTSLINYLEANPDIDEGIKGPVITAARAKILWLRTTLPAPQPMMTTPCCYSRKPLIIR